MVLVSLTSSGSIPTAADGGHGRTCLCMPCIVLFSTVFDSRFAVGFRGYGSFPELHLVIQSAPPKPQFLMHNLNAQAFSLNCHCNRSSSVSDPDLS